MNDDLERLIANRKELIEAHRKNGFTDGIHALLTDLYPDTAHFIYELLQNAEDMKATRVRFILSRDGMRFAHNGTKRSFNVDDIDAITNIGHNAQKRDDPTSIGKFGVGFKAVFAYTTTPIIHSGKYHFCIRDYFVPDVHVEKINTVDESGTEWTVFDLPFNNPKKQKQQAFDECDNGLKMLDDSSILFLRNIKRIEYQRSGVPGYIERINDENNANIVTINSKTAYMSKAASSRWLRFDKTICFTDDKRNQKESFIAVAFSLIKDNRNGKEQCVPVDGGGKAFIYFPAEKEHTGFRFHINAPFASTVARDSVRSCDENNRLIADVAKLIADSLPIVKKLGLMDMRLFDVFPNDKDDIAPFYQCVLDEIKNAFQKNKYLPTFVSGGYATSKEALSGPGEIASVLTKEDLTELLSIDKPWIKNAPLKNSNADRFIQGLGIQTVSSADLLLLFDDFHRSITEKYIEKKKIDWHRKFLSLCKWALKDVSYSQKDIFIKSMRKSAIILGEDGKMYCPDSIYILPKGETLRTTSLPIVSSELLNQNTPEFRSVDTLMRGDLEIPEYGQKIEIKLLLQKYQNADIRYGSQIELREHFSDMLAFARYNQEHYGSYELAYEMNLSHYPIFMRMDKHGKLMLMKAVELSLGKAYGNEAGELLSPIYQKPCLWDGYAKHYSKDDYRCFIGLIRQCEFCRGIKIIEQRAERNELFKSRLDSPSRTKTQHCVSVDYTIDKLDLLLAPLSIEKSKLIWQCLIENKRSNYDLARYCPNGSAEEKQCPSTLILRLRENKWLPNRNGEFFCPKDITTDDLHPSFEYDPYNKLLVTLQIGSAIQKEKDDSDKLKQEAEKRGYRLITNEQWDEYYSLKKEKGKEREVNDVGMMSAEALLKKQNKYEDTDTAGDTGASDGAVQNILRRERNIEQTFQDSQNMKPLHRKLFGKIVESSKDEKAALKMWYQGFCQMCDTLIINYKHQPHFIAKNIIHTSDLTASVRSTTNLAWNSVCLCPNCSAKYNVCVRDLNGLYDQILNTEVIEGSTSRIELSIKLDNMPQRISYAPEHFLRLKTAIQQIDRAYYESKHN